MNRVDIRRYEMLLPVRDFGQEHVAAFPSDTLGGKTFAEVNAAVSSLSQEAASQASGLGSSREATISKASARAALRDTLEAFSLTAQAISLDQHEGLDGKFRLPRFGDQRLLASARGFVQDAQPYTNDFIAHGMPGTFIADLNADIDDLEQAIHSRSVARETRAAARLDMEMAMEQGLSAVIRLDAIVRNILRTNATAIGVWGIARRVEYPGRHHQPTPVAPHPPSPAAPAPALSSVTH